MHVDLSFEAKWASYNNSQSVRMNTMIGLKRLAFMSSYECESGGNFAITIVIVGCTVDNVI